MGSKAAKAAQEGVSLSDISDDDNGGFEEEEEEEDEELDVEFEEEALPTMAPRNTPSKKKAMPSKASAPSPAQDITNQMNHLSIGKKSPFFCMDFKLPYIISTYNESVDIICKVEVFVPTLPESYFILDVISAGTQLELRIQIPQFFTNEDRVMKGKGNVHGFNINTHEAQAFKDVCEDIDAHFGMVNHIFGDNPFVIDLPFPCEERVVEWGLQAYNNKFGNLKDKLKAKQYHGVLLIKLQQLKTKHRTAGRFEVVVDDDDDDSDEEDGGTMGDT
jgi:hypothetical protein